MITLLQNSVTFVGQSLNSQSLNNIHGEMAKTVINITLQITTARG